MGDGVFLKRKAITELLGSCSLQRLLPIRGGYSYHNGGDKEKLSDLILYYEFSGIAENSM